LEKTKGPTEWEVGGAGGLGGCTVFLGVGKQGFEVEKGLEGGKKKGCFSILVSGKES